MLSKASLEKSDAYECVVVEHIPCLTCKIQNKKSSLLILVRIRRGEQRSMWIETAVVLAAIAVAVRYLYLTDSLDQQEIFSVRKNSNCTRLVLYQELQYVNFISYLLCNGFEFEVFYRTCKQP